MSDDGYNNIIYLDLGNNRYSFYYLYDIDINNKRWNLDCRLEEFYNDLADNVLTYCSELFRKYYFEIYGDNEYRDSYWEKCEFLQYDQEQLLNNIILLLYKPKLMKSLQCLLET